MMRITLFYLLILFTITDVQATADVSAYQWHYRVLLAQADTDKQAEDWIAKAKQQANNFDDRKLILLVLTGKTVLAYPEGIQKLSPDTIRSRLGGVLAQLTGLDGNAKASYDGLDFKRVFKDIDSMPMRQAELRSQSTR